MTSLLESELRDLLATRLEVLEPGLSLVRCDFSLRDAPLGTRGRIDILARDRHGLWVIIELKRERSSSRQALHEIAKYAELLQRDKQLAPDRIRALIVSTDWTELLVPVSNMARDWSHDLRGYELHVDVDGRLDADRVALLPESPERYITPVHGIYLYASPRERDRGWRQIRQIGRTLVRAARAIAQEPGDVDVTLRVYNPCDLVQAIVHGWPDELDRWQPGVIATAEFADGTRSVVQGMLCADGYGAPGFLDMVHVVYRDPIKWMTTRYGGVTWEYDQGLLGLLGLRYVLLEIVGDGPEFPAPEDERGLWLVEDGQSMRISSDDPEEFSTAWQSLCFNGNLMTLRGFLAAHRHEVDALRVEYLSCTDIRR
ncbi:endonuclease NucS domain-containing protein [Kitasatospora purpeofusca]|uniref:endonuclease NucS domain-containing protein n=1 Tax=Kitasatospora purpeofusca TaxID=67352 RepID=UPI00224FF615|nr:endonuclease NucS domain-containing protein [Kitasatospora purpeofusca]MCX4757096.1 endonuclease NucS [Kitasatospora purpeofusca]WSR35142.1 endonuclease NucS [Kitasatospora purpeofusca]WSR43462.1 endonuclease NucS [Kitasatospora purpeofusca]